MTEKTTEHRKETFGIVENVVVYHDIENGVDLYTIKELGPMV